MNTPRPPTSPRPPAVDALPHQRPGVSKERSPRPFPTAHVEPNQRPRVPVFTFKGRMGPPVVVSNAQPPRGVSGLMRRIAYRYPEHMARHFMWLLYADRVDVLEHRLGRLARQAAKLALGALVVRAVVRGLQEA